MVVVDAGTAEQYLLNATMQPPEEEGDSGGDGSRAASGSASAAAALASGASSCRIAPAFAQTAKADATSSRSLRRLAKRTRAAAFAFSQFASSTDALESRATTASTGAFAVTSSSTVDSVVTFFTTETFRVTLTSTGTATVS